MVQVIFSDVDGTLLNSRHQLTPLNRTAIQAVQRQGVPFVIVSARSPSGVATILRENGLRCPVVCYSGALMLDESGALLFHQGFPAQEARRILRFVEESPFDMAQSIYSFDQWLALDTQDPRILREASIVKVQAEEGGVDSLRRDQVHKLQCIGEPEEVRRLEEQLKTEFPAYTIVRSADFLLEVMAPGVSKASAVRRACALWQLPVEASAAFGDNYNDVDMLEAVGCGFLMGNAPRALLARFPLHAPDNEHDGVYHGIVRLGLVQEEDQPGQAE